MCFRELLQEFRCRAVEGRERLVTERPFRMLWKLSKEVLNEGNASRNRVGA